MLSGAPFISPHPHAMPFYFTTGKVSEIQGNPGGIDYNLICCHPFQFHFRFRFHFPFRANRSGIGRCVARVLHVITPTAHRRTMADHPGRAPWRHGQAGAYQRKPVSTRCASGNAQSTVNTKPGRNRGVTGRMTSNVMRPAATSMPRTSITSKPSTRRAVAKTLL